jgi:excisionase family DNA binding protein
MSTASASRGDVQATAGAFAQGEFDFSFVPIVSARLLERRADGVEEYSLTVRYERPKQRLKVREVAALLGCSRQTVERMLQEGQLEGENPGKRLTVVYAESVERLRRQGREKLAGA